VAPGTTTAERWARLPADVREEIDVFQTQLERVKAGQTPEKVFTEFRLRHGVYGQRQDGVQMQRIKIPLGMLTAEQMICLADLSEEISDGVSHVTTRQDIQFHFVDIDETPNMMRRLAEVGITTKEACGNVVRNVTGCPQSGVCSTETFDITPHAQAMARFLLRHPDAQNFGRKFKVAYSGCAGEACGLARMHDIGAIAVRREEADGTVTDGFQLFVGGGLGAIPHQAQIYSDFVAAGEMLPLAQAMSRVFARLGEKNNRARARMKFLVDNLGIDEFRRLVEEERARLPHDTRWIRFIDDALEVRESPLKPPSTLGDDVLAVAEDRGQFRAWLASNVRPQAEDGYSMVEVFLPLGDITADQLRSLAVASGKYIRDTIRTTVSQNLLLRWVSNADLPALYRDLVSLGLARTGASRLADVTSCPGTDSCKLGITSSRGLAATLDRAFGNGLSAIGERDDIKVKISGCFNSCGQHHIADIGFLGSVQRKGSTTAPVFQVVLGGTTGGNAESYGLVTAKVPARQVPKVLERLTSVYTEEKLEGESFTAFVARQGKVRMKSEIEEFTLRSFSEDPDSYLDNRQTWEYHKETGVGECAGEVVDQAEFMLEAADRMVFEATLALDGGQFREAADGALGATRRAADALLSTRGLLLSDNYDCVAEFRRLFYDTGSFHKPFAENFFRAVRTREGTTAPPVAPDDARRRVEEAALFLQEAQTVYSRA
jgi:sulfite reductase (ferredoxin)